MQIRPSNNIIVNADDFGRSFNINEAVSKSFQENVINQTTIMVNMPCFDEAIEIAKREGFFDKIGLHLTLDEGSPLSLPIIQVDTLCSNGKFIPGCIHKISRRRFFTKEEKEVLKIEIEAQISKFISSGFPLRHIDSHHHVHVEPQVLKIIKDVDGYFDSMRRFRSILSYDFKNIFKSIWKLYINMSIRSRYKTTNDFVSMTDVQNNKVIIDPNKTIEIMVHPVVKDGVIMDRLGPNCFDKLC